MHLCGCGLLRSLGAAGGKQRLDHLGVPVLGELSDLAKRSDVSVTRVPFFDTEVRSVYGLRAMSAALFD